MLKGRTRWVVGVGLGAALGGLVAMRPSGELPMGEAIHLPGIEPLALRTRACEAPGPIRAREEALVALLAAAGATPAEVEVQDIPPPGRAARNVILRRPGRIPETLLVAAHLDHLGGGRGVVDDWSGIVAAVEVFRATSQIPLSHSLIVAGFGAEEDGLRGSRAFLARLPRGGPRVKAMVNLECLGVGAPGYWWNGSSPALAGLLHRVADREGLSLERRLRIDVDVDAIPFAEAGIPTVTIDGLPSDRESLVHSPADDCPAVAATHLHTASRLVLAFVWELDRALAGPSSR